MSAKQSTELKPCPFCGNERPYTYISVSCAVLRCQCGATMEKASAQVLYKRSDVPDDLKPYIYEANALSMKQPDGSVLGYPEHGYVGINVLAAFEHAGITERWNRRVV
jgi:hypothetical protein